CSGMLRDVHSFPTRRSSDLSDLIKCWWKTDKNAVEVAEQFTLTLTCGVSQARGAQIIPKMESLDPGAVQFSPFEVVRGTRHEDIDRKSTRLNSSHGSISYAV